MEPYKMIFHDRNVKLLTAFTISLLLILIFASQLMVLGMAEDYKKSLIEHDYAVAGRLSQNGIDTQQIIKAFTSAKTTADTETGSALLSVSGYRLSTQNRLLPEVSGFYQKYALTTFMFSALFSFALLVTLYFGMLRRDKQLGKAIGQLRCFMEGATFIRLEDSGEDSLSLLFSAVNTLATSLTAHIEKEKQNRAFLKDTISDISHQLKTPLAALQMYNEIIMDEKTGNETVESFTVKSQRELERMGHLIQSLLKLAKLDAGTIVLEKNTHKLKNFLENILSSFLTRAQLEGKSISLQCHDLAELRFDEIWLGEAVGNIIKNALDHTKDGDQIAINCEETVVATEIIIKDNGAGIHPADIHHIFKRFYRSRFSKDLSGVGIGLALSKAIVEKHGGTVTVQSELGKGAQFHLIFSKLSNL